MKDTPTRRHMNHLSKILRYKNRKRYLYRNLSYNVYENKSIYEKYLYHFTYWQKYSKLFILEKDEPLCFR